MGEWSSELGGGYFISQGDSYLWRPDLVWLHALSDALIALSFFSIPICLIYFARRRPDLPFAKLFTMFGAFIVACGLTHFLELWTIWHTDYYFTGAAKAITAVIAMITAVWLWKILPAALRIAGPAELRRIKENLEERVSARTVELEAANERLKAEIAVRHGAEENVIRLNELLSRRVGELRTLLAILPVGVAIADDARARTVRINRVYAGMLGIDLSAGTLEVAADLDVPGTEIFHKGRLLLPEERPIRVCTRENRPVIGFEKVVRRSDGTMLDLIVNAIPLHDDSGAVSGCVAVQQDVSALRSAERERQELDRKILETQKLESLGVLAGGIAHDFNNLLTSILGNASLAGVGQSPGSPVLPYLKQIEQGCQRAAELCNQMLAYSGRGRFVMQDLDLNELINETTHLIGISLGKTCVLRLNLARSVPRVHADSAQIRQIIMNLVINASEAIGARSGVVALTTGVARVDADYRRTLRHADHLELGDYVFIEVSDNGCGMSPETLTRIFEPFFTTKFTGRGLGLAAVLGIIRSHGGALKVYSEPDRGTTFKIFLPALATPVGTPADANGTDAPIGPLVAPGSARMLVVDDEETVRVVAARMMEELGFVVDVAADGREAVEKFRADPARYQLVLLDLTMPHLDGEETFRQLRHLRPGVGVVLMSGFTQYDAVTRFAGKGLAGFIQKPFTLSALVKTLRESLRTS